MASKLVRPGSGNIQKKNALSNSRNTMKNSLSNGTDNNLQMTTTILMKSPIKKS
jgi:hypothetical protein